MLTSLTCGHTFHDGCLGTYIDIKGETITTIKCPCCKLTKADISLREQGLGVQFDFIGIAASGDGAILNGGEVSDDGEVSDGGAVPDDGGATPVADTGETGDNAALIAAPGGNAPAAAAAASAAAAAGGIPPGAAMGCRV